MEQHTLIAIGVALVYGMGVGFTKWGITKAWFNRALENRWVSKLHWAVELLCLSLFLVDKEHKIMVLGAIMLCCLPAIIRWTTADYKPEPETRLKEP